MPFKKFDQPKYPRRCWAVEAYSGGGKSTFLTQLRGPILAIDADQRLDEVLPIARAAGTEIDRLSDDPTDNLSPDAISRILLANMPGSGIKTIAVDTLTPIIVPLVMQAMVDKEVGREKSLAAAFRTKAVLMRLLVDAVSRWGVDTVWAYHLFDAKDNNAKDVVKKSVTKTELDRLQRVLNMRLEIVMENGRRGIKVVWCRTGRSGMTLWDTTGCWRGMPEKIEAACYDGLAEEEKKRLAALSPQSFASRDAALAWAVERGVFTHTKAALPVYTKIKTAATPQDAQEMAALWVAHVNAVLVGERAATDTSHLEADEGAPAENGEQQSRSPAAETAPTAPQGAAAEPVAAPATVANTVQEEARAE